MIRSIPQKILAEGTDWRVFTLTSSIYPCCKWREYKPEDTVRYYASSSTSRHDQGEPAEDSSLRGRLAVPQRAQAGAEGVDPCAAVSPVARPRGSDHRRRSTIAVAHKAKEGGRLSKIGPAPAFTLTRHGRRTACRSRDLRGKVVAVTFIYATCTDTCPLLTAKMAGMQTAPRPRFRLDRSGSSRSPSIRSATRRTSLAQYARNARRRSCGLGLPHGHPGRDPGRRTRRYGIFAKKTARGDVDHTFLTSIVDRAGTLRVQYLGLALRSRRSSLRDAPKRSSRRRRPRDRLAAPAGRAPAAHGPREAPGSRSWPSSALLHRRRRGGPPRAERGEPARRGHGEAPAQDRRLPPAPARHHRPALQRRSASPASPTSARSRRRCASSTSSATTSTGCSSSPRTRSSCSRRVREDYEEFIQVVTEVIELIRARQGGRGTASSSSPAPRPLADRLERLTNELVNKAEADMVASIEASHAGLRDLAAGRHRLRRREHRCSASLLGYAISWSLIEPVQADGRRGCARSRPATSRSGSRSRTATSWARWRRTSTG